MTDVISGESSAGGSSQAAVLKQPISAGDKPEIALIELLFFAYRDFISDPDAILDSYDFGRAHHRVLHFVNRHPGIRVSELLKILKITKQSLGRVLKQLIDTGFIQQRPGPRDRRQRLLYPTAQGRALALRLLEPQTKRVRKAIASLPPDQREAVHHFLEAMVDDRDRDEVVGLIGQ